MFDTIVTVGILLDVSSTIRKSSMRIPGENLGKWTRSMFNVIDDLIKYDISPENKIFCIAVGADCEEPIFDALSTLRKFQKTGINLRDADCPATDSKIDELIELLKLHGVSDAPKLSRKAIRSHFSDYMITFVLTELKNNKSFAHTFCEIIIPSALKKSGITSLLGYIRYLLGYNRSGDLQKFMEEVVIKTKGELLEIPDKNESVMSINQAREILHDCIEKNELAVSRGKAFFKLAKPFIYGKKPLLEGINLSQELFKTTKHQGMKKLLFVISDGQEDDIETFNRTTADLKKKELKGQSIAVVSCFISKEKVIQPKKLYSSIDNSWSDGAQFLFKLSSKIPDRFFPRAFLVKRGWKFDISNNNSKLFIQVSHPDNIREACDIARNIICTHEALSELLVSISLEKYINQSISESKPPLQDGGTCYANACATVIHLAMKRILGREGGYPEFEKIREELIELHGREGACTYDVLQNICPKYRLQCKRMKQSEAFEAIASKRPVVAIFHLTVPQEWDTFCSFFDRHPTGVISKREIDISKRNSSLKLEGHAVVLTSFNSQSLFLMNSWGEQWGDKGFFRVKSADVLNMQFIDVYWTDDDLKEQERKQYEAKGSEKSKELMQSLKSLQIQKYNCPLCHKESLVTEFTGTLSYPICPKCKGRFSSNEEGNILPLNMFILSCLC